MKPIPFPCPRGGKPHNAFLYSNNNAGCPLHGRLLYTEIPPDARRRLTHKSKGWKTLSDFTPKTVQIVMDMKGKRFLRIYLFKWLIIIPIPKWVRGTPVDFTESAKDELARNLHEAMEKEVREAWTSAYPGTDPEPLTTERIEKAIELLKEVQKPRLDFDAAWIHPDAIKDFKERTGYQIVKVANEEMIGSIYGPRIVPIPDMPPGRAWLIKRTLGEPIRPHQVGRSMLWPHYEIVGIVKFEKGTK